MVIAFFSAEKMLQNYNKYLTYTNKLLFFCRNAIFLHIRCTTTRFASAKLQQKNKRRKGLTLYALISHKLTSERMNE